MLTMAKDVLVLVFGYLLLVAPPNFLSNTINNLGLAKQVCPKAHASTCAPN